jgi:hypothetical protein
MAAHLTELSNFELLREFMLAVKLHACQEYSELIEEEIFCRMEIDFQ